MMAMAMTFVFFFLFVGDKGIGSQQQAGNACSVASAQCARP